MAQLLRERRDDVIRRWVGRARRKSAAAKLEQPYLIDSMPDMLEQLAHDVEQVEQGVESEAPEVARSAHAHAKQRLTFGYDLAQLISEYADLRVALQEALADKADELSVGAWHVLDRIIDGAVGDVMERYNRAREQKLRVFERFSVEPLQAKNLQELLEGLLEVMGEVAPEVDTATILLREGNELRVRASRGLEDEVQRGFSLAVGDGFAGTIAARREPLLLHDAARDPLVKSDYIRQSGTKALYGVPLVDEQGEVIGVAHMGSLRATEFQEEDLVLFRALANRATSLIVSRERADQLIMDEHQRERFISLLAHDLRSPLNSIVMSTQLLLKMGQLNERDRRAVMRMSRAGDRMARMIGDLLDFARTRGGRGIPLSRAWFDLGEIVRAALEDVETLHPTREVRFSNRVKRRVFCDADRVAQVVTNLVGNAVEHGAADAPVEVTLHEDGEDVVLTVHNEGRPIPGDLLPHVFEPFRRGSETDASGVGLGLFIAEAVAVAHGGSIEVESAEGRGTTFFVRLPASPRR
jgi:signal transduction histidine kinase